MLYTFVCLCMSAAADLLQFHKCLFNNSIDISDKLHVFANKYDFTVLTVPGHFSFLFLLDAKKTCNFKIIMFNKNG